MAEAFSLAAIYSNGPFYGSLAYESMSSELGMDSGTSLAGSSLASTHGTTLSCNYIGDDYTKWKIGLGLLDWNGFTLAAIYSQQDDRFPGQRRLTIHFVTPDGTVNTVGVSGVNEQSLWQIQAGYAFGNNKVKAMYGSVDRDDGGFWKTLGILFRSITSETISRVIATPGQSASITTSASGPRPTSSTLRLRMTATDIPGFGINDGRDWDGFSAGMIHKF